MTIQEVIKMLQDEKKHPVKMRYHCRAIMVRTIAQYSLLLEALKGLGDIRVFSTDELFTGPNVMPGYERLMSEAYQDQWLLPPGVSEYLRLFHADEERAQRFGSLWHHQWDADTTGRILIPLWGVRRCGTTAPSGCAPMSGRKATSMTAARATSSSG